MAADALLALWNDTPARRAIVDFVHAVSTEGSPGFVAPAEFFDDGPTKPVRIWSRVGYRPLVLHDDADREFAFASA